MICPFFHECSIATRRQEVHFISLQNCARRASRVASPPWRRRAAARGSERKQPRQLNRVKTSKHQHTQRADTMPRSYGHEPRTLDGSLTATNSYMPFGVGGS